MTLEQNDTYTLNLEFMGKRHGGWWLELIERATGQVKILKHENKSFFADTTIEHALRWTTWHNWQPMYKAGRM